MRIYKRIKIQQQKNQITNLKMGKGLEQTFAQRRSTKGSQARKRCLTLVVIREMQIKTTTRCYLRSGDSELVRQA
jgi:hypothetical protein